MHERDPAREARERYDLIVVGGGIHGCMVLLEAALLGRKTLLLERAAFGGATSANSLRVLHGGLRYLQSLDLVRFFESVRERRWFLATFPELTEPLACLMPLYGRGFKRPIVLRLALAANDALSLHRNRGVRADRHLPRGRLLSRAQVIEACPFASPAGLAGGALWYDAHMLDSTAIVADVLRRARAAGGAAVDRMDVDRLALAGGRLAGVHARDLESGRGLTFEAPRVINAAGPWAPELLERFGDGADAALYFARAWNLLLDRPAPSPHAVALTAPRRGAQTFFLRPAEGRILIGTGHAAWGGDLDDFGPSDTEIDAFLADVNCAAPALELSRADVLKTFAGLLPTTRRGAAELTKRSTFIDHGARGGHAGLFTVVGIKFTTARDTARKLLKMARLL